MELAHIVPPIALPGIALLLLAVVLLQAHGNQQSRKLKRTRQLILQFARTHAAKKVTVAVELTRRADTILPMLDHLYEHDYRKLEIIVIIKQTAGSKARSALDSYRRKNQRKGLRIISHRKGLTPQLILRRYASGDLVVHLEPSDRLSPDFFPVASFHFIDPGLNVLLPQTSPRLDQTISSATGALLALLGDTITTINQGIIPSVLPQHIPLRSIVRKRWILGTKPSSEIVQTYSSQLFVTTASRSVKQLAAPTTQKRILSWRFHGVTGLCATAIAGLTIWNGVTVSAWFALSTLLLGYCVVLVALVAGSRSYALGAKLNLILFAPFSLLAFTLLIVVRTWKKHGVSAWLARQFTAAAHLPVKIVRAKS